MDNGYNKWVKDKKINNKKRKQLLLKFIPISLIIMLIVFFFGYDKPLFDEQKITEFIGGTCGLTLLFIAISFLVYKPNKFIPICNKCGKKIKNIKKDCEITNIKYVGTEDKIIYKTKRRNIKGKTVYPRGGYSMRNDAYEYSSESTFDVEEQIPLIKKYYLYDITYACKNCYEEFTTIREESDTPLKERKNRKI